MRSIAIREDYRRLPATWRILQALLRETPISQAELRSVTGLSHPIIVQQVALLRQAGLIALSEPISGLPGRPPTPMTFNWNYRRLLALEVHPTGISARITNLWGTPEGESTVFPLSAWSSEAIPHALRHTIQTLLATPGAPWVGIGVVIPGIISRDGQSVLSCQGVSGWQPLALGRELAEQFELPVTIASLADALAEAAWADHTDGGHQLLAVTLRCDGCVSAGMIIDGHLASGADSSAGAIGHIAVAGNTRRCSCGRTGCLETLLQAARTDTSLRPSAIEALGQVIVALVNVLNPGHFVLQGDAAWSEEEFARIRSLVEYNAFPAALASLHFDQRPYRAQESLLGIANRLAARALDFDDGILPDWVEAATKG